MKYWQDLLLIAISILLVYLGVRESRAIRIETNHKKTDIEKRKSFFAEIRKNVINEKFDQLETTAAELQKSKARFPGGDWKARRFYEAVTIPTKEDNTPDHDGKRFFRSSGNGKI